MICVTLQHHDIKMNEVAKRKQERKLVAGFSRFSASVSKLEEVEMFYSVLGLFR